MSAAERSRRNVMKEMKILGDSRDILEESGNAHLKHGKLLAEMGYTEAARDAFRLAEIQANQIVIINARIAPYEERLRGPMPILRNNGRLPDARASSIFTENVRASVALSEAEKKQEAYAKSRGDLRPITDRLYGHLAKAEKMEVAE